MAKSYTEKNFEAAIGLELLNIANENNVEVLELLKAIHKACSFNYEENLRALNITKEAILAIKDKRTSKNFRE